MASLRGFFLSRLQFDTIVLTYSTAPSTLAHRPPVIRDRGSASAASHQDLLELELSSELIFVASPGNPNLD
jgi:hypothetical protein